MPQSILDPAGPGAATIEQLWWVLFWVLTAVFVLVSAAALHASLRRRRGARDGRPELDTDDRRALRWVLFSGAGAPVVILIGIFVYTLLTLGALSRDEPASLTIRVTGVDWWWSAEYAAPDGQAPVHVANEIHVPVGEEVELRLLSADVIHSFWVPRIAGKMDMVPGRENVLRIRADEPGVYRGQCAEYCGVQHTRMAMLLIAEPREDFDRWLRHQASPAAEPTDSTTALGREVFMRSACRACHAIRGTEATSRYGPDLTHVASRRTLGAAMLPNTHGHMAGWLGDPQAIKPGVNMPAVPLEPGELKALAAYMMALR